MIKKLVFMIVLLAFTGMNNVGTPGMSILVESSIQVFVL